MSPRVVIAALPLLLVLHAVPVHAEDGGGSGLNIDVDCDMDDLSPKDRFSEKGDLIIPAGASIEDAIAIDGDVVIKSGASVSGNAISVGGSVIVEPGAVVEQGVISIGGKLQVSSKATVRGSRIALGDGIALRSEDGEDLELALKINGKSLGQSLADEILRDVRACLAARRQDAGR